MWIEVLKRLCFLASLPPRRRREGESGLPTIASFLRSVWLVMVLGNHGLYCVFLACAPSLAAGKGSDITYLSMDKRHTDTYTQPLLRCLYSTQEPVCMKQDRNAIEMCDQSKYRKERRLVYKRSSQEKKKIRRFWECSLKRCRNRKWVVSTLMK